MKPVIGITVPCSTSEREYLAVRRDYIAAVENAGGLAVLIPADTLRHNAVQWAQMCDGLLFSGGGDILPHLYGEEPLEELFCGESGRDEAEIELIHAAAALEKPVLGICRGIQLMNVAWGGTLWQDLPSQCPGAICHRGNAAERSAFCHSLSVGRTGLLASVMGAGSHGCNSFHHQAVKKTAHGFAAAAWAPDGTIEAIEHESGRMLGVQWHPESLCARHQDHAALFSWLIEKSAAGRRKAGIDIAMKA